MEDRPRIPAGKAANRLLTWYDAHARELPWRAKGRARPDPYCVWLSEIMLQQTTVATVVGYFDQFLERWPTVDALASAHLDTVLHQWQGLGYYARARNLHKCARIIAHDFAGRFPDTEKALRELPGIGAYTAAAIAAIAFDRRAVVVDGNVERVMARLHGVEDPLPGAKRLLHEHAARLTPGKRPGDYAQAVMDLGATICTPRSPSCDDCPWHGFCAGRIQGIAEKLPRREPKAPRPTRRGAAFWLTRTDGRVLLRRRPERGLLGGLMEVPTSPWIEDGDFEADGYAPARARWRRLPGVVRHTFTHFHLELVVYEGSIGTKRTGGVDDETWVRPSDLGKYALPTLMKKVVAHVDAHAGTAGKLKAG